MKNKTPLIIASAVILLSVTLLVQSQRKKIAHQATSPEALTPQSLVPQPLAPQPSTPHANVSDTCFQYSYQHVKKNQDRDIEEFLNDTNVFPILHPLVNEKNICVRVNQKPVHFKLSKKTKKQEVILGPIVGPEAVVQISYCTGKTNCKVSCPVKSKNKVDELLSDHEMGNLENAELEGQVNKLRGIASTNDQLMESSMIREWNTPTPKEWLCRQ